MRYNTQPQLTDSATARLLNMRYAISGLSMLGGIGGVIYSNRTGGGGWRGVGYFLLGSFVTGIVAGVVTLPFSNKILKEGIVENKTETYTETYNYQTYL